MIIFIYIIYNNHLSTTETIHNDVVLDKNLLYNVDHDLGYKNQ